MAKKPKTPAKPEATVEPVSYATARLRKWDQSAPVEAPATAVAPDAE